MDEKQTKPTEPGSPIFRVAITLSSKAPAEWAQDFNERWKMHFYTMKRNAKIQGDTLLIECVPEEIQKHHIPELQAVISATNLAYSESQLKQRHQEASRKAQEIENIEKIANLKKSLKFD
jgi:hypothetical protein